MDLIDPTDDDQLILQTQGTMSHAETNSTFDLSFDTRSLKNTSHLKALSTSLRMALSHYALGVEIASTEELGCGGDLLRFEAALEHHLRALVLARETSRLRAAFTLESLGLSAKKSRMTTRGRDLSVVSWISVLHVLVLYFMFQVTLHADM